MLCFVQVLPLVPSLFVLLSLSLSLVQRFGKREGVMLPVCVGPT